MKRYSLLPVLLTILLLLTGCAKEEADMGPAEKLIRGTEQFSSVHTAARGNYPKKPGSIMATEWNDLANWHIWAHQLKKGEALAIQEKWKFSVQNRYTVLLTDSLGQKIPDARIFLETQQGRLLVQGKTDNTGRCELFPSAAAKPENLRLKIVYADQVFYIGNLDAQQGIIEKQLNIRRKIASEQDIVFVINTSGSMADEMQYLQTGLKAILNRVKEKSAAGMAFRLGSVFYGEQAGKPVNHTYPLTTNLNNAIAHIKEQSTGKNNTPGMVDMALEDAIYRQPWSKDATSRILFLILDTQPEYNPAVVERLASVTREAARQGIRIIPIVAGSIPKETELLLRSLSIRTNGTYIFTSSGNSTGSLLQEPDTADYTAEHLSDLLVRLMRQYNTVR